MHHQGFYQPPPLYTHDPYAQPYGAYAQPPPPPPPMYWQQPAWPPAQMPMPMMPMRGAIDAGDDAEQRARDVGGLFAKLHGAFVAELRHLKRVRPNARQVTPLIGLLQQMSPSVFGTISSGAASVRVFTFHEPVHGEQTSAAGVLRELHRALHFLIGQVAENIHHTHMHAMNAGLRIFRNMMHFYARKVTGDHAIDEYERTPDDATVAARYNAADFHAAVDECLRQIDLLAESAESHSHASSQVKQAADKAKAALEAMCVAVKSKK
jgi:hypothetical protein